MLEKLELTKKLIKKLLNHKYLKTFYFEESLFKFYQNSLPERVPLSSNKEFKTIRNDVVKEAFQLTKEPVFIMYQDATDDLQNYIADEESDEVSVFENDSQFNIPLINTDLISKNYSVGSKKYMSDMSLALSSLRLAARLSQLIEKDIKEEKDTSNSIDRKLRIKMAEKRMAQGQKMG